MAAEIKRDPDLEWLDHVQPVGLVVAPVLLKELGLAPSRQTQADSAIVAEHIDDDSTKPVLYDLWGFFEKTLGWEAQHVAGAPNGPGLTSDVCVKLPEHDTVLSPTWAVKELGNGGSAWQLLVRVEPPGIDPDARASADGWEATAHQRFERLLRETGIFAGVLVSEKTERRDGEDCYLPELRLVYAPRGETSGHLKFPLRALGTVAGRPMLGGLKLLLGSFRLFADATDRRLPALLKKSRAAQAAVSTALAEQVLGALHELLRGLDAAAPDLIRELARTRPAHLYEGLLTVLMRLVFILYAEDRDLLPSRTDGRSRKIYETSYSLRGLYARLTEDVALNPDTMDERRGGWGRLLALFRLIHKGHPSHFVQARGGKLFDPDQFPFLEDRAHPADTPRVLDVSDGCCLRILEGLMTLQVRGAARERLSYRTLDVEQIGSVYETVMGFAAKTAEGPLLAIKAGKNNRTPVYVDLEKLVAAKGKERIKYLKEEADRGQLSANVAKAVEGAKTVADLAVALDPIVDERGSPKKLAIAADTPILQPTDERRRTGSHYTPRSLTEPIVRHALEPAFERLGKNATPEQILDLKVCDPAMGSGAFLVEACRALAIRLVEAWGRYLDKKPVIPADEDAELHAKRLVAQRCLYGVDKNPLATDLAKLSLWLATLARDHEFTFLDHALKSGDSLVGLTQTQIAAMHWDTSNPGLPLFRQLVKERVAEAMKGRAEIQAAPDDTARAIQEQRHRSLEARLKDIRLMGDAVIAAFFAGDKRRAREKKRAEVESWLTGSLEAAWDKLAAMAASLKQGAHELTPFHWEIEFPEVVARENGGFDAIVGNPPFLGGKSISTSFGDSCSWWLEANHAGGTRSADLVAHFFRRALILQLYDFYSRAKTLSLEGFLEAAELVESYVFRRAVCDMQTRSLYQIFASLAYRIRESDPLLSLKTALFRQTKKRRFPTDTEFREAFEARDVYDMRNRHYLLDRLENDSKERIDTSSLTIEHVMPQNEELRPEWREMLGSNYRSVQEKWQHRLGNLTLTGYNSEYSDLPFEQKKALIDREGRDVGFNFSPLRLNKFIREQSKWTEKEIEQRGTELAARAVSIWSMLSVDAASVRAAELEELRENAAKYKIEDIEFGEVRDLFDELRTRIFTLGEDIIQLAGPNTITFRVSDFFVEVIPRKRRLALVLNLDFDEADDPSHRAIDATERAFIIHATETGGVLFRVEQIEHIGPAMHLIRQAYEKVSE